MFVFFFGARTGTDVQDQEAMYAFTISRIVFEVKVVLVFGGRDFCSYGVYLKIFASSRSGWPVPVIVFA